MLKTLMIRTILIAGIALVATVVPRTASATCASWGCTETINELYVTRGTTTYVGTPGDESLANCTVAGGGTLFWIDHTEAGADRMYSVLLTAKSVGAVVTLRVVEGTNPCKLDYADWK